MTTEVRRPIRAQGEMRIGKPSLAWEVLDGAGSNVGLVVLFEAGGQLEPTYIVRNEWHQDLGRVDQLGRAFRYVPHAKEAAWVGSGTLLQGIERILQRQSCQLIEMPMELEKRAQTPGELEKRRADGFGFKQAVSPLSSAPQGAVEVPSPSPAPGTRIANWFSLNSRTDTNRKGANDPRPFRASTDD